MQAGKHLAKFSRSAEVIKFTFLVQFDAQNRILKVQ